MTEFSTKDIYATLPKSLKSEVLVRSRVENPEIQRHRRDLVQSKSVSELSQVKQLSDFPIPTTLEKLHDRIQGKKLPDDGASIERPSSSGKGYDIYATLPRSLKTEVMVRTKVEEDEDELKRRQNLVETKSPAELSQINSFSEIPLPRRVEAWLHHNEQQSRKDRPTKSLHEIRDNIYDTLPKSLKEPTLVRSVREHPDVQRERYELTRAKTPSQLAEIKNIHDIPIPGLWTEREGSSAAAAKHSNLPKNAQEVKELVYKNVLPESLTKPCVVRSRIEDPDTLRERQDIQQRKSIHELSKIRNLNEFPLPVKVKLPDIPLPSAKGLFQIIARTPQNNKPKNKQYEEYTPTSTPSIRTGDILTDDEMLRYDASTPGGDLPREQDFGYEVIDGAPPRADAQPSLEAEEEVEANIAPASPAEEDSLADQYRGTPPLKSKKKKQQHRQSHELSEQVQLGEETPPPLPPKRPSSVKRDSPAFKVQHSGSSTHVDDFHSCADDASLRIQSRPLPAAPGADGYPLRQGGQSGSSINASFASAKSLQDQFHSLASTLDRTLVDSKKQGREDDDETLADSVVDSMHSCQDDDATLHSCAETLEGSERDFDSPTPPVSIGTPLMSTARSNNLSDRIKYQTEELERELSEHVKNLKTSLDSMSQRLTFNHNQ